LKNWGNAYLLVVLFLGFLLSLCWFLHLCWLSRWGRYLARFLFVLLGGLLGGSVNNYGSFGGKSRCCRFFGGFRCNHGCCSFFDGFGSNCGRLWLNSGRFGFNSGCLRDFSRDLSGDFSRDLGRSFSLNSSGYFGLSSSLLLSDWFFGIDRCTVV
jgi:hypothetical protein